MHFFGNSSSQKRAFLCCCCTSYATPVSLKMTRKIGTCRFIKHLVVSTISQATINNSIATAIKLIFLDRIFNLYVDSAETKDMPLCSALHSSWLGVYCCSCLVCIVVIVLCVLLQLSCVYCCGCRVCIVVVFLCVLLQLSCVYYCRCLVGIVVVVLCVLFLSYMYLLYCVCALLLFFTLDAGLLTRSQYSEGPATGHLDTGFSCFPCVYKQMLSQPS